MASQTWNRRKIRTRDHVAAEMSVNILERQVLQRRHLLSRMAPEYGTDAIMFHFSPDDGRIENGQVQFQLKAQHSLKTVHKGSSISVKIDTAHLNHWGMEIYCPFILVVYDVPNERAFWLDFHGYINDRNIIDRDQQTITVHVPTKNELTPAAISTFREMSLSRMRRIS